MLREVVGIFVAILFVFPAMGSISRASETRPSNWVPYPWAQELPFTWATAQGVWSAGEGSDSSYFYIRVTKSKDIRNVKFLAITERDRSTCATVALGFGTEEEGKRIVAEMKSVDDSRPRYRMMLSLYHPDSVPKTSEVQPFKGKVMVLSIKPNRSKETYSYPMVKISDRTEFECNPIK